LSYITKAIRKFLLTKGYTLVKASDTGVDAITYNTEAHINSFYTNTIAVEKYINEVAVSHAKTMLASLHTLKVDLAHCTVVDMACGTGHFLQELNNAFRPISLLGLEINEAPLTWARKLFPEIKFEVQSVYEPLKNLADVIFLNHVLEHLPYPEDCLTAMFKSLAPNGKLIIHVPNGRLDTFDGHIHFYSEASLQLLVKKYLPTASIQIIFSADKAMLCALVSK
jgi:2-polyprenyl-3-methyl-5-hydroxy-6-metoxy-1,4-benzoquinol methylase